MSFPGELDEELIWRMSLSVSKLVQLTTPFRWFGNLWGALKSSFSISLVLQPHWAISETFLTLLSVLTTLQDMKESWFFSAKRWQLSLLAHLWLISHVRVTFTSSPDGFRIWTHPLSFEGKAAMIKGSKDWNVQEILWDFFVISMNNFKICRR